FEGIQKALTKEVKEMKDVFEELEAEVTQCAVDRKHDAIDRKNLLIANDNLIAECLSKEAQNDMFRAENDRIKQHYKEFKATVNPQVSARDKHAIDVEPIVPCLRNNRDAHLDYLRLVKETVETIYDIVEEAKLKKQVTATKPSDRQDRVKSWPKANGSQPKSNPKTNRISPAKGANKLPVEDLPRTNKSHLRTTNHVDSSSRLKRTVVQIILWYLDSGYLKHMTGDRSRLLNFMKKFIQTVRFGNDHFGAIMGYGDYVVASKNNSWLWHHCLNHLNFSTINDLARKDFVRGFPRLKFEKDHLCSACQLGKSKKNTHKPKVENTNLEVLNTLHMDLCGPMRVQTINGKKYILVIVDDYSRFTWVKFLRSKDETPDVVIKFITQIQVGLNKTI
nr:integrase, catalytic region, zinc finger, CCHC-type, peptidase aspartic, catalytic [Tanacetum cinerariifolium]